MHILVSNDDGCQAPGLRSLVEHLAVDHRIDVVAPDRNRSGASSSLTLLDPLRVQRHADGTRCVNGTPTDCVHLALTGLLEELPDMVVSGINAGANLGDDVLYSGTVAAAIEGRFLGFPALAMSCVSVRPQHLDTAARVAVRLIAGLQSSPLPSDSILNVNVPDVPWEDLTGFRVTRLGNRHRAEGMIRGADPRGREIFWVGQAGPQQDAGPGTDFHAIAANAVSITPIQTDLTQYAALERLTDWAGELGA